MVDTPKPDFNNPKEVRKALVAKMWELASIPPERSRGMLRDQIAACKLMLKIGYQPALQRLSEIASMDASRTKGRRRDQEAAEKLLKSSLIRIKPDTSGVQ
ncbi:MAG: hypothetical protein WCD57_11360 [Acidobacteriaceae bacterium]